MLGKVINFPRLATAGWDLYLSKKIAFQTVGKVITRAN